MMQTIRDNTAKLDSITLDTDFETRRVLEDILGRARIAIEHGKRLHLDAHHLLESIEAWQVSGGKPARRAD
jgi:hypothetical protein